MLVAALSGLSATGASAQATSQRHIPIKKEARHVDTVWIHDTVTVSRVDTLRLGELAATTSSFFRVDTLVRVDSTKDCRDIFLPVPLPIPFNHGADNPGSSFVSATPEPATIVLVGIGLVGVGLIARRKESKKDPP